MQFNTFKRNISFEIDIMDPTTDSFADTIKEFLYDCLEIVSTLNRLIDAVRTIMAVLIEFVQLFCAHPVWGILWEHLKIGKDLLVEIFDPFVGTGKEAVSETGMDYSEQAKDSDAENKALASAAMEFGRNYLDASLEIETSFIHMDDCDEEDFWNSVITISVIMLFIVMVGLTINLLIPSGWNQDKGSDVENKEVIDNSDNIAVITIKKTE